MNRPQTSMTNHKSKNSVRASMKIRPQSVAASPAWNQ